MTGAGGGHRIRPRPSGLGDEVGLNMCDWGECDRLSAPVTLNLQSAD